MAAAATGLVGIFPFVPAKDYAVSVAFYEAMGFAAIHRDADVTLFRLGAFGFILQNFYLEALAGNFMMQLLVEDVHAWWDTLNPSALVGTFDVKPPIPPGLQHWGLTVGYVFDPSGVLWHVAQRPS